MATVTSTYLVDDLDGATEDVETVRFNAEGKDYEIDLSAANAARLREKLERFVSAASPVKAKAAGKRVRGSRPAASGADQVKAIREWATSNGYEVSSRGRISQAVRDAFDAAH